MFMTEEEVAEFTGIRRGRDGKTKHELQVEHLRRSGVPFWLNARGVPKIVREHLTNGARPPAKPEKPAKKWEMPARA